MLTKLSIRHFKCFDRADIDLDDTVVFIGPNNSGKTSALQALALWESGLHHWWDKYPERQAPKKRPGVTLNRRNLIAAPVPEANLLWKDIHTRDISVTAGKQKTQNVCIDILVEGITKHQPWKCGLEFDYANPESLYCRPQPR